MLDSGAFSYVNVLSKAADASFKRNELLVNNLANNDTPGYKRKDLDFEVCLNRALESSDTKVKSTLTEKVNNIDLEELTPYAYTDYSELSYRLDQNNVDTQTEESELASNQIVYNTLLESMLNEFNRIKAVLT